MLILIAKAAYPTVLFQRQHYLNLIQKEKERAQAIPEPPSSHISPQPNLWHRIQLTIHSNAPHMCPPGMMDEMHMLGVLMDDHDEDEHHEMLMMKVN